MINFALLYILLLPFLVSMAFYQFYLFGDQIEETQTLQTSIFAVFRFTLGVVDMRKYYEIDPMIFTIYCVIMIIFFFYLL